MAKKPVQERLAGMPGPAADVLAQRERLNQAFEAMHEALTPIIERVPMSDGESSSIQFRKKIKGDFIQVVIQPGKSSS